MSCVQELSIRTQNLGSQKFGAFQSYIHEIRKSHELNRTIFINSLYLHCSDMDPLFRQKEGTSTYIRSSRIKRAQRGSSKSRAFTTGAQYSAVGRGTIARQCNAPKSAQTTELPSAKRAAAASRGTNGAVCTYLRAVMYVELNAEGS